jgi:short-subunit dehydrogenase
MDHQSKSFALITGAGCGLGSAFAAELAGRGINVLLTALPGEHLGALCTKLELRYKITARFFECDLTQEAGIL